MTHHFSINANYTLSWSRGWSAGSSSTSGFRNYPHDPVNPWNPLDFGYTPQDERHHITFSGIWELPWGFQVSPILQFGTARPYDLTSSYDVLSRGTGYFRPVIVPINDPTNYTAFNVASGNTKQEGIAARACLAAGQCREVGYDTVRGDAFFQLDTRIAKNIRFKEHYNVQLFFQAFNLTNRANFGNNFYNAPANGKFLQQAGFINPSSTMIPRSFNGEFGARFTF